MPTSRFALNPDGSIDQAKMRAVSSETDFSFDFQDSVSLNDRSRQVARSEHYMILVGGHACRWVLDVSH